MNLKSDFNLVDLLKQEAVKRGFINRSTNIDLDLAFCLVRDMPYRRASSRAPEATIREWQGTCSGKHYLLKVLYAELGYHTFSTTC